ncbi:phage tail protein [Sphingomonas sp.]|uniref:phage tail protein n=1 Tax=Sphingomonas sp. TaxID=28214 RepID=UPI003B3A12BA
MKADSLKAWLTQTVPGLADDPGRMDLWLDVGGVHTGGLSANLSFEYRYTVSIDFARYTGDLDAIVVPLLAWIIRHQPDLLAAHRTEPGIRFEASPLDADTTAVSIDVDLRENVRVLPKDGGGFTAEPLPAPDLSDTFGGAEILLRQIYRGAIDAGDLLAGDA